MEQLRLENISKKYDGKIILQNISHSFQKGETVAFMGHNGCGKSTLLKLLAGLIAPTSGKLGSSSQLLFHYVPEKFPPVAMNGKTYLHRMGELDGLDKGEIEEKIQTLAADFYLEKLLEVPMKNLSKGSLQKIGVIQALLKTPDVLLLDEPLSGQDVDSQKVFVRKIRELKKQGVTVFLVCHEPGLAEALADQVFTIKNGALEEIQTSTEALANDQYCVLLFANPRGLQPLPEMRLISGTCLFQRRHLLEKQPASAQSASSQNVPDQSALEQIVSAQTTPAQNDVYKLRVSAQESNPMILKLLQEGWELRGMYDEENV